MKRFNPTGAGKGIAAALLLSFICLHQMASLAP
jgi:hypothetical protein